MMSIGKNIRLQRIFKNGVDNCVIIPMDHGITMGPIKGIKNISETIGTLSKCNVDGIILHKGMITSCEKAIEKSNIPLIMHLSASTRLSADADYKICVGTVEQAVSLGCDAVSVQINIGDEHDDEMLRSAAMVSEDCYKYGMPLLAMMYAKTQDPNDSKSVDTIKHLVRIAAEIGADIIKVSYANDYTRFHEVVESVNVPVIIAGGEKYNDAEFLKSIEQAMKSGIRGISAGRNIFQSDNMYDLLYDIDEIVHKKIEK
jgi:predicted phospho-2-dehydro-3-deoxyheptonate aldolase